MKKKQFMSKLAALTMAAAMGITALPATTVFAAQTVAVDQSEAAVAAKTFKLTANGTEVTDTTDSVYTTLKAVQVDPDNVADNGTTYTNVKNALESLPGSYTDLKITASGKTVTVSFNYSDSKAYVATFSTVETSDISEATNGQQVADAVDEYFADEDNTLRTYSGEDLNSATVLAAIKAEATDSTTPSALRTALEQATDKASTAAKLSTYTLGIQNFSKADGEFTGTLTLTEPNNGTTVYTHTFTGSYAASTDSSKTIVDNAVASLAANPIPDAGSADDTVSYINAALKEALKDTGIKAGTSAGEVHVTVATGSSNGDLYVGAEHGKNGSIVVTVTGGNNAKAPVTFTLKESSAQKLDEANKKFVNQAASGSTPATTGLFGAAETDKVYLTDDDGNVIGNTANSAFTATAGDLYVISDTSKLSRSIQAKTATEAVDSDAVKTAIENAVADAVKDYDGDGVTYKTEVVPNKYLKTSTAPNSATISASDKSKWKDTVEKANKDKKGTYLIKVSASIPNDFYVEDSADAKTKNETSENVYYVLVETSELTETKVAALDIADQTVVYKNDTKATDASTSNDAFTVNIKPTLTPADANSKITWTVDSAKDTSGKDITKPAIADTYGTDAAKLVVTKPGTYKVTATYGKIKDSATITVTDTFADAPSTAYFYTAVKDAYAGGVTNGVSATSFGAGQNVTRAQFVTFLYNYAKAVDPSVKIKDADVKQVFSDVPTTAYYAKAVQWAYENKITSGTGDGKFRPNAEISRAQAVTFIYNAKNKPDTGATGSSVEKTIQFTDVKKGSYYEAAVTWGVNNDVVYGLSTTSFGPDNTATRAQAITFIARAYGSATDKVFSNPTKY